MVDLYTAATPNGHKASFTLEALGMPYETHFVNISEGDQEKPEYLEISPNLCPAPSNSTVTSACFWKKGASPPRN